MTPDNHTSKHQQKHKGKHTMHSSQAITPAINPQDLPTFALHPRFECNGRGVFWIATKAGHDGETTEAEPLRLADPIDMVGIGTDAGGNYYRIISYRDRISRQDKTAAIATADIGTQQGWQRLQGMGLFIANGRAKREKLADYMQEQGGKTRYTVTDKAGWHGNAYILPSGEVLQPEGEQAAKVIYNGDKSQAAAYQPSGSLAEWQEHIAAHAQGNSRLLLALGVAFAAPLLPLLRIESGGFHLYGDSSDGKTTAARVALSVWGKPEESMMTWQGTNLAFSNTASARNDGLLVLDEIGQATPKVVGATVYGIMNGINKVQGAKEGGNRALSRWRVLVLSTGEKTPDSLMRNNADWNAGQATRLPSIPANAGAKHGLYDHTAGFANGAELSEHLQQATAIYHGEAGRAFIRQLQAADCTEQAHGHIAAFMDSLPALSGQARRVAKRFALLAAALELAAPITRQNAGVGMLAMRRCFDDWIACNGSGKFEDDRIKDQTAAFMQTHAHSQRFTDWNNLQDYTGHNHAGYRKRMDAAEEDEYWIIPAVFEDEICKSFTVAKVCTVLHDAGWLKRYSENRWQHQRKGIGRFYVLVGMTPDEELE